MTATGVYQANTMQGWPALEKTRPNMSDGRSEDWLAMHIIIIMEIGNGKGIWLGVYQRKSKWTAALGEHGEASHPEELSITKV